MITWNDLLIGACPQNYFGGFVEFNEKVVDEIKNLMGEYYASSEEVKNDLILVRFTNIYDFWKYPFVANKEITEFYTQILLANTRINSDLINGYISFLNNLNCLNRK